MTVARVLVFTVLASLAGFAAAAGEALNARPGGVAVKGYDVVAYFTMREPTRGTADFEHVWQGVRWQFVNREHLAAFADEPTRYAPRFGGFCAGGVALGNLSPIDPEAFVIVDGKLYLNFDQQTADDLSANAEETIARAEDNWKTIGVTD